MTINWELLEFEKSTNIRQTGQDGQNPGCVRTRTEKTERAYWDFSSASLNTICRFNSLDSIAEVNSNDIFRWIGATRITYRSSSWRFARAACTNLLERAFTHLLQARDNSKTPSDIDAIEIELKNIDTAIVEMKKLKWAQAETNVGKTPAQRSKELPKQSSSAKMNFVDADVLFKLDQFVATSTCDWQRRAMKLCWATLYCGLRPCEWERATITDDGANISLIVRKPGNTNGGASGDFRQLLIKGDACQSVKDQLMAVQQWRVHVSASNKYDDDFRKSYVAQCANALRIAQIQLFGESKGITPFSFRHQFAANLKATGQSKLKIADAMGLARRDVSRVGYSSINQRKADAMAAAMPKEFENKILSVGVELRPA